MKRVLLVEDREDDVLLFKHALKHSGQTVHLDVTCDGEEAINFLTSVQPTAFTSNSEVPDLILLDIRMPKVDGLEVLQWIRKQAPFSTIPVVMLSTSAQRDDILKASQFGANSYILKEGDLIHFSRSLETILKYWLELHQSVPAK